MIIDIKIAASEVQRATNDIHIGLLALERLRQAGVPVVGTLFPVSVSAGSLTITEDIFGDLVYAWEE